MTSEVFFTDVILRSDFNIDIHITYGRVPEKFKEKEEEGKKWVQLALAIQYGPMELPPYRKWIRDCQSEREAQERWFKKIWTLGDSQMENFNIVSAIAGWMLSEMIEFPHKSEYLV